MSTLKVPVTLSDHIQGNVNAPLTLVEYGDYECPYCGLAHLIVKEVQKYFKERLRFVFRHFPLAEVHPHAEIAAESAEYAGDNGHFWEMHDLIYNNQNHLSLDLLCELVVKLKLSKSNLITTLKNKTYRNKAQDDFIGGIRSGVNGTPTFFTNGNRYNGTLEFEDIILALEK